MLQLNDTEIDALLPSPASEKNVKNLIEKLMELDKVTKKLQPVNATILVARAYFDTVLKDYSTLSDLLDSHACTTLNPLFKSGVLKV